MRVFSLKNVKSSDIQKWAGKWLPAAPWWLLMSVQCPPSRQPVRPPGECYESATEVNTTCSGLICIGDWGKQMIGKETGSHPQKKRNQSVRKSHPGKCVASEDAINPNGMNKMTLNCLCVSMHGCVYWPLQICSFVLSMYLSIYLSIWFVFQVVLHVWQYPMQVFEKLLICQHSKL